MRRTLINEVEAVAVVLKLEIGVDPVGDFAHQNRCGLVAVGGRHGHAGTACLVVDDNTAFLTSYESPLEVVGHVLVNGLGHFHLSLSGLCIGIPAVGLHVVEGGAFGKLAVGNRRCLYRKGHFHFFVNQCDDFVLCYSIVVVVGGEQFIAAADFTGGGQSQDAAFFQTDGLGEEQFRIGSVARDAVDGDSGPCLIIEGEVNASFGCLVEDERGAGGVSVAVGCVIFREGVILQRGVCGECHRIAGHN